MQTIYQSSANRAVISMTWLKSPYFGFAWLVLAALSYFFIDLDLTQYVHNSVNSTMVEVNEYISQIGKGIYWIIGGLAWFVLAKYWFKSPKQAYAAIFLITAVVLSGLICNLIKVCVGRARPVMWFHEQLYGFYFFKTEAAMRSFPSGHSTTITAAMMAIGLSFRRMWLGCLVLALLVCFSRIVVQAHYLSDVLVGMYLGTLVTLLIYPIFSRLATRGRK